MQPVHYLEWSSRGSPASWRYLITLMTSWLVWIFGAVPIALTNPAWITDPQLKGIATPWGFLPGLVAVLLLTRLFLGRPSYTVMAPAWPLRPIDYLIGIAIGYSAATLLTLLDLPFTATRYTGFGAEAALGPWLISLIILGLVVQTAFEEVFFRGLIVQFGQAIGLWLPLGLVIQAVLFAIPHFGNVASMSNLGLISVSPYFIIALTWGWTAWRSGSLLMSMGLHFANNSFGILVIGTKGDIVIPYAPFLQTAPSLNHAIIGLLVQSGLTVIGVEITIRHRAAATKLSPTG